MTGKDKKDWQVMEDNIRDLISSAAEPCLGETMFYV